MASKIDAGVEESFLKSRPKETALLQPFLNVGFDVTWARQKRYANADLTFFFLKANPDLVESYGFEYELLLAFSPYNAIEPRVIQAVDQMMDEEPAKGRVESMLYFLASNDANVRNWISSYLTEHRESRIPVPFYAAPFVAGTVNSDVVRTGLHDHFYTLDRFKYTLPLKEDTYFFGRTEEIKTLMERVRRSENSGLFGLRKTGKTSLLLKLKRSFDTDETYRTVFIDAQSTSIRVRKWNDVLKYIVQKCYEGNPSQQLRAFNEADAADHFEEAILGLLHDSKLKRVVLIIDEIEWISPTTCKDEHWNHEFLNFWHAIRAFQNRHTGLSFIVAGVNPFIVETDIIDQRQNPLFGIVSPVFLAGLKRQDCKDMVQKIGKIMGLRFGEDSIAYLMGRYGGHPLLTRLACSYVAQSAKDERKGFPYAVTDSSLRAKERQRDDELVFYVRHVVSELEQFYSNEYKLLEAIAIDNYDSIRLGMQDTRNSLHLFKYGIIANVESPYFTCDVVRDYVSSENARKEGRRSRFRVVAVEDRDQFLRTRMKSIVEDMRALELAIKDSRQPSLFGPGSFPESDRLFQFKPPADESSFAVAMTALNRSFVEPIENYGKHVGQPKYFWQVVKLKYPTIHTALHRIKVYRHYAQHAELNSDVNRVLREFLNRDLDGDLAYRPENYWILFQRSLDELLNGIQKEVDVLNNH
jgi:hypothetical protein